MANKPLNSINFGGADTYKVPNPVAKTADMTKAVGVDSDGKLWTEPGGGGGTGDYTTEKIFAAAVNSLEQIGTNSVVPSHNSVMFTASEDTTLRVGNANMIISAPTVGFKHPASLEPALIITPIADGYSIAWNPAYTGTQNIQATGIVFSVNLEANKTYTLAFNSTVMWYLYVSGQLLSTTDHTGDQVITFTPTANATEMSLRVHYSQSHPSTFTKVTLCEGNVPLPYGQSQEEYQVSSGESVCLANVKGVACSGAGVFYNSPLAVTELNGVKTKDGKINTCATNKTFVNMGDSIWAFGSSTGGIGTITEYAKELCGGEWTNISTGGSTMASRPGSYAGQYDAFDFWKLADAIVSGNFTEAKGATSGTTSNINNVDNITWSDVDCITIAFGTNDLAFGAEIDNNSNLLDKTTICGALRYGVQAISGAYPNIRFKALGIVYRSSDAVTPTKIVECNEALKKAAAYVGAEFVDGYGINGGNSGTFLYDGTHPNEAGKKRIAETLARSINDINL